TYLTKRTNRQFVATELGTTRDQDERAVRVTPDAASFRRGLNRFRVTSQVIKHPALVREPRGCAGIARAKAQPPLERLESLLVAAVEAQHDSKVKMTKGEVLIQLDRPAGMRYRSPDVTSPMARLSEHILGVRILGIEL